MTDFNRIYLMGMPSSGKSTLGKQLAKALQFEFLDLDKLIEQNENKSIPRIFVENGENYFREIERKTLRLYLPTKTIISLGGGTPCFFDNLDFIKANGLSLFLDVPVEELTQRVIKQKTEVRPMFNAQSEEEVLATLTEKYQQRIEVYRKAHISIRHYNIDLQMITQAIEHFAMV